MERLLFNPKYERTFAERGWNSLAGVVAHFLPPDRRGKVNVQRVTLPTPGGDVDAFFKVYDYGAGSWGFWLRSSKARREFENYKTFARLGVPAAEPIACGEERDALGRLRRAFILTRAVPSAGTLIDFCRTHLSGSERAVLIRELAGVTRRLHDAHFFYYDLVWRNILVSSEGPEKPKLFLIDCPRGGFARFGQTRKRLRDLASLDKSAAQFWSRRERWQFLQLYAGAQQPREKVKALARACLEYRRTRWPEDWQESNRARASQKTGGA